MGKGYEKQFTEDDNVKLPPGAHVPVNVLSAGYFFCVISLNLPTKTLK